eukprot:6169135-Ditylum_brightwellii.AAC.1
MFDITIKSPKGTIFAIYLKWKINIKEEVVAVVPDKKKVSEQLNITVVKPQWLLMVEEHTGMKWAAFFQAKNGMIEPTC